MRKSKQLTVRELIEKLQKVEDKELPVITEGRDCDGYECDVSVEAERVYIIRDSKDV